MQEQKEEQDIKLPNCPKGTWRYNKGECVPKTCPNGRDKKTKKCLPVEQELPFEELPIDQELPKKKILPKIPIAQENPLIIKPKPLPIVENNPNASLKPNNPNASLKPNALAPPFLKVEKVEEDCNNPEKIYSNECNKFLLKKELMEREELAENPELNDYLYPSLNDPNFIIKIAEKKEFNDTQYNGEILDVQKQADLLSKADFELAPHQAFVRNFLSSQTPYNSLLLWHGLGSGKCHKMDTPIMMSDGSIKMVQDIKEGEFLMGDDSTPRKVLSLARGVDKMYDIIPIKGDTYTVNQEHILCLKMSGFPKLCENNHKANTNYNIQWIENNRCQSATFTFQPNNEEHKNRMRKQAEEFFNEIQNSKKTNENIIEISVKDYLKLSNSTKANLKGYKVPIDFPEVELPMDPYMIGYWLGDGSSKGSDITSQDSAVIYYFAKTLQHYNLNFMYRSQYTYGISGTGKCNNNVFLNALKEHKLINNKHIPNIYKYNSRENRLKLLAGLIDSDGSLDGNSYEFSQKNEKLMDDVIFLARSLGFSCYKNEKKTSWTYKGIKKYGSAFRICINGYGIEEIPTKIPRKKAHVRVQKKDVLVTGIKVEYVNEDNYYGFTLDGNCRYLLGDFTVTHNTLSSIGVCEEQRSYMKQMGLTKRIIVVASPNVQDNFRTQLFDERKLKLVDGLWNIRDATGNKLLKEINPMNMKGLEREKVISQIKGIINHSYLFLGYIQFANYIERVKSGVHLLKETANVNAPLQKQTKSTMTSVAVRYLQNEFDNRLIVIDEIHNIRITEDNENKNVALQLTDLVKSANNLRLLFLSATPMYNSYKEIIWLLNIMNLNDRRSAIRVSDVFDKDGEFKKSADGKEEIGKELLVRKATGYISYVRGENPYTFPFRVYPSLFAPEKSVLRSSFVYPKYQMNGKEIAEADTLKILDVYLTQIGSVQAKVYKYIIESLRRENFNFVTNKGTTREMPSFENMESFGYTLLQIPIEALIIGYPIDHLEDTFSSTSTSTSSTSTSSSSSSSSSSIYIKAPPPPPIKKKPKPKQDTSLEKTIAPLVNVILEPTLAPIGELSEEILELTKKPSSEESVTSFDYNKKGGKVLINKNELVGTKGLERMMEFVDTRSPPEKGSFKYRAKTLDKYGRIFSPNEIGKYSGKIKNICNSIYNPDSEGQGVSDGIIIIYSQYIDGGLIPVALALEEMGFTRYGQSAKSLFDKPPVEPVDSITMKPKNKTNNNTPFMPAKYIMITGDSRISPDNNAEVKAATSENNKDGHKIKVILISKAGSEGLDFKFIRQVHILEPWYNMNRLEQIIGRAVRNFSHKDLPFEKRNVEIFMYGTILQSEATDKSFQSDKFLEEAADLYVYRSAEYKAVQIGQVSRLLKETAVDCILNHEQTNFTQENMSEINKKGVKQLLSTGLEIPDFKVGDAPFSATCDYMANCEFKCIPNKEITEEDIKLDTYNENFILMNSEKIIKKVRELMKERFFYKKDNLISRINYPKPYPLVQIYAALTQIIGDTTEFITDKYGRTGYLVNIGEYYLFQPSELNNSNISIFERSAPIDFKHKGVELYGSIKAAPIRVPDIPNVSNVKPPFLLALEKDFDIAMQFSESDEALAKGENNWYKYCGVSMRNLIRDYNIPAPDVSTFLVEHIVDFLMFEEKVELLEYLYSLDIIHEGSLEYRMKEYIDTQLLSTRRFVGIILVSLGVRKMFKLIGKKWIPAETEDEKDLYKAAVDHIYKKDRQFNSLIGLVDLEKKNKYLVFKLKNTLLKRNTGTRCDEAVKSKRVLLLNEITEKINGQDKYVDRNISEEEETAGFVSTKNMVQAELCSLMEFLLRYYNKTKKNDKVWFANYEIYNIYSMMYTM